MKQCEMIILMYIYDEERSVELRFRDDCKHAALKIKQFSEKKKKGKKASLH